MDFSRLKKLQKTFFIKFFLYLFGTILSFILATYIIMYYSTTNLYLVFCVSFGLCCFAIKQDYKKYENKVKKMLLPHLLNESIKDKGILLSGKTFAKKLFEKSAEFNKYDLSYIQNNEFKKTDDDIATVFNIWDITKPTNDYFSGIYNDTIFSFFDGNEFKEVDFKCIVIKIACDIKYKNKLVITRPSFVERRWKTCIRSQLKKLEINNLFANSNFKIYTNYPLGCDEVLSQEFMNLINNLGNKYIFVFGKGNLYIICPTSKDYFKLGSLFKRIDDLKQYQKFIDDIQEILKIIETTHNLEYLMKANDKIIELLGK